MAVSFVAAPTITAGSSYSAANVASLTTAAFAVSGSDRYLVAGAGSGAGTRATPSAVRWRGSGGDAMTQVPTASPVDFSAAQPFFRVSQWTLDDPAVESNTVHCAWPSNQDETMLVAAAYAGVSGQRTAASANGTNTTPTVNVTTVAGDWVVDVVMFGDVNGTARTLAVGAGQTSRQEVEGANLSFEGIGLSDEEATGTTTTMSWTLSGEINGGWGIIALPLIPAAEPAASPFFTQINRSRANLRPSRKTRSWLQFYAIDESEPFGPATAVRRRTRRQPFARRHRVSVGRTVVATEITVSATMTVPAAVLAAAGTVERFAAGDLTAPALVLAADVTLIRFASGDLAVVAPVLEASAGIISGIETSAVMAIPAAVLAATAERAVNAMGVAVLTPLTLAAAATLERFAAGDLDVPAARLRALIYTGDLQIAVLTNTAIGARTFSTDSSLGDLGSGNGPLI